MKTILGLAAGLALLVGAATPSTAQDRWQLQLNSGAYMYDLQLVKLERTSLLVRHGAKTVSVPVRNVNQLELIQPTAFQGAAHGGAHDVVYQLTLLTLDERMGLLRKVLAEHPPKTP